MKMQVTLTPEEVKQIIKDHLQKKFRVVGDVTLDVSETWQGYGYNEHKLVSFKGAVCEVKV